MEYPFSGLLLAATLIHEDLTRLAVRRGRQHNVLGKNSKKGGRPRDDEIAAQRPVP